MSFFEFIPQLVFMLSIFGYLCFTIIFKWFIPYTQYDQENRGVPVDTTCGCTPVGTQCAPRLLNVLIYMFLAPTDPCQSKNLFPGQVVVQLILFGLAVVSIPLMLLPKPLILRYQHKKAQAHYQVIDDNDHNKHSDTSTTSSPKQGNVIETASQDSSQDGSHKPPKSEPKQKPKPAAHGEEFEFGEIMIHQLIETIEFVLGAVSNTASYLRLWALSLAHSELATVFWDMLLVQTVEGAWYIGFIGLAVWFGVTLGVLMVMESLSAFLHALRLHWVEYQNKFYAGDGKKFLPFSYEKILADKKDEEDDKDS